jgi:5-methylcytosine-specific restriction endonuclease McrA
MATSERLQRLDALVLGQGWDPLERVPWQKAMVWWVAGRVEVIEVWPDILVQTATTSFPVPSVVRFHRSRRRAHVDVRFSRDSVWLRDEGRCQYCATTLVRRDATYDHILPRSRGGRVTWTNIVLACRACNQKKGNRTPSEARMQLLRAPKRPALGDPAFLMPRHGSIPNAWRPYLGLF